MALLFLDSVDHYTDPTDKYLAAPTGTVVAGGRHGKGLTGEVRCAPNPTSSRVILGAAFKFSQTFIKVYELYDVDFEVCSVFTANDGAIEITMFGGPTARTAADLVRVGQWHYLEVDVTITTTVAGSNWTYALSSARILLDGVLVLNTTLGATILSFVAPTAAKWTHVDLLPAGATSVVDDIYICDGAGPAPHNAPLGDIQIGVIRPNGAGASTQWTPVGASANWDAVNDLTPDDDTTQVSAATVGFSDLYTLEDVSTTNSILGAQLLINARRTDEGAATLAALVRHAGTTTELPARALTSSYFYRNRDCFVTMPNGDPLTDANVNALQAGLRRTA
jgi:hypothetical protein